MATHGSLATSYLAPGMWSFFFRAKVGLRVFIFTVILLFFFFFQAEDGIRDLIVTGVQTCALPIYYGVTMGDHVVLDADSFLMKGEVLESDTGWRGNPAKLARTHAADSTQNGAEVDRKSVV